MRTSIPIKSFGMVLDDSVHADEISRPGDLVAVVGDEQSIGPERLKIVS